MKHIWNFTCPQTQFSCNNADSDDRNMNINTWNMQLSVLLTISDLLALFLELYNGYDEEGAHLWCTKPQIADIHFELKTQLVFFIKMK